MREDLRIAVRSLRKSPGFTAIAISILALGIGSATAIFSIVDAVVLRGLPFDQHDRIVAILEHDTIRPTTFGGGSATPQMFLDWRRLQEPFEAVAVVSNSSFWLSNESGEPVETPAQRVTREFFPVLRVAPLLGRSFTADDEVEGQHRVAILSYGFWQRRFGGSTDALGKTISLGIPGAAGDESWEVVGVMPRGFSYPVAAERPTELYIPRFFRNEDKIRGESHNYSGLVIGRLKDGVTIGQAHDQMNRLTAALDAEYPRWSPGRRARVVTLHQHLVGRVRGWMLILLGAVGLVLLIACANVANLMLVRATVRSRETGIRAALGASRWRLTRGFLMEGILLSLAGVALGVLLAYLGSHVAKAWLPANVPRVAAIAMDLRVLGAAIFAALLTGTLFSIVPAIQSSRPNLTAILNESGRSATAGATSQRLRSTLVVAEVALAVVLLVAAGLFIGSFTRLMRVDVGFDYHNLLTVNAGARPHGSASPSTAEERVTSARLGLEQILDAVRRIDGIDMVGAVSGGLPLTGTWSRNTIELPGRGELKGDDESLDRRTVTADYLKVLRVPLIRGRFLSEDDREGSASVMIVNQAAARKYWPGQDALGQRVKMNGVERTVVGIVGDIRHLGPESPARQEAYIPMRQDSSVPSTLVMRTTRNPLATLAAVKTAIWAINPRQRFTGESTTVDGYMDRLIAQRRFNMALLALFGALGLVIAAAGIYGVMAYVVAQRTNEIGIRMALGATPARVLAMVLRQASLLIAAGLVIGGLGAWYLSAVVKVFLFEVEPHDVRVFAIVLTTLALVGLIATAVPARRAAAVDPLVALRHE